MIINQANLTGLYRSFSTVFNKVYSETPSMWETVAMLTPSTTRENSYPWLGDLPMMREWIGDRVIKDMSAYEYTIRNKSFESTFEVKRVDIEDDQIGIYQPRLMDYGRVAKQHGDVLTFSLLKNGFAQDCWDGQFFFDTDHPVGDESVSNTGGGSGTAWYLLDLSRSVKPLIFQLRQKAKFVSIDKPDDENVFMKDKYRYGVDDRKNVGYGLWQLAYGSKQPLDATNYAAARAAMMSFKNDNGVPLGITPTHLVYPPTLEGNARALIVTPNNAAGAGNPWYKTAEPLLVPWLA